MISRIQDFKGLYTNYDTSDLSLDYYKELVNMKCENGYIKTSFEKYQELNNPTGQKMIQAVSGYIIDDQLKEEPGDQKDFYIFVLSHTKDVNDLRYRIHYSQDCRSWQEIGQNLPQLKSGDFGDAYFQNDKGVFKLYINNEILNIGKLDRKLYKTFNNAGQDLTLNKISLYPAYEKYQNQFDITKVEIVKEQNVAIDSAKDVYFNGSKYTNDIKNKYVCYGLRFAFKNTDEIVAPMITNEDYARITSSEHWTFYYVNDGAYNNSQRSVTDPMSFWCIPADFFDKYFKPKGRDWEGWKKAGALMLYRDVKVKVNNVVDTTSENIPGMSYILNLEYIQLLQTMDLVYTNPISDKGFSVLSSKIDIAITGVYDGINEVLFTNKLFNLIINDAPERVAYKVSVVRNNNFSDNLTGLKVYIKLPGYLDYELVKVYNFLDKTLTNNFLEDIVIGEADLSEKYLTQNLGYTYDTKDNNLVKYIKDAISVCENSGVKYLISKKNPYVVYYSLVGGGNIMRDIFVNVKFIPGFDYELKAVLVVDNKIAVVSEFDVRFIQANISGSELIFNEVSRQNFGVDNAEDVVAVQGGILLNTRKGLVFSNGYQADILPEINDIVLENINNSKILYNQHNQELYYFPDRLKAEYFLYDFLYKKWCKVELPFEGYLVSIFFTENKSLGYLCQQFG